MSQIIISLRTGKDRKRRGFILLTHAVMLLFTIAMVGLAVDAGTMYVIKGRLSSAVDAAALAAGRSVNLADTVAAAATAATATATQFFNANFPNGYLGTGTVNLTTPTFTQQTDSNGNPTGILSIAVSASVPAPTYFMRIFGINSVTVASSGTASRRGTVMILVLDISTSMNTPTTPTACAAMISAAQSFITNFSPYDTVGAITFNATASLLYAPSTSFGDGTLNTALGNITCGSSTNTTSALYLAYEAIKYVGLPLAYNSIVLFTDGSPNGVSANFPLYWTGNKDQRYGTDSTGVCGSSTAALCNPLPAVCTAAGTVTGTITQGAGQETNGSTSGLDAPISSSSPINSGVGASSEPGNCATAGSNIRQLIAYIPDTDIFNNSTHGVVVSSTAATPLGTVQLTTNGATGAQQTLDTRDFWVFPANNLCATTNSNNSVACASDSNPGTQWGGGPWSSTAVTAGEGGQGTGSNFFTAGSNKNFMRPDQPTTIVAASMNTAMAQAYWIRHDASGCGGLGSNGTACGTLYHPVINTIYLTGNLTDAVDHEFLPVMSNVQQIPALPYDATWTNYNNPAYEATQESGLYQVTADKTQLAALFQKLASQVLRLSQ
jgi:Flp pilus assembly protein TadG